MALTRRFRILSDTSYDAASTQTDIRNGQVVSSSTNTVRIQSSQLTLSEGHMWPKGRNVRDIGGPFDTVKLEHRVIPEQSGKARHSRLYVGVYDQVTTGHILPYYGGVHAVFQPGASDANRQLWPGENFGSDTNLTVLGTKFISQTIPTSPVVDGAVGLAELFREGIPSMIGSQLLKAKASFFRELGSEYLNYEFGWKPLISDLQGAAKAITESEKILKTLEEHSGEDLRRKRLLPQAKVTVLGGNNVTYPSSMPSYAWSQAPIYRISDTTTRQQWFSGCYTYHFEPARMNAVSRIATEARHLLGIEITPEVLWNLAPWSWLVDWFANVGPVLSNVSAFQQDGLVLRYGYVMERTTRSYRRSNTVAGPDGLSNHPSVVSDVFLGTRKRREKATPYGFGLNSDAFSVRQWAILGALGITRIPKQL